MQLRNVLEKVQNPINNSVLLNNIMQNREGKRVV